MVAVWHGRVIMKKDDDVWGGRLVRLSSHGLPDIPRQQARLRYIQSTQSLAIVAVTQRVYRLHGDD